MIEIEDDILVVQSHAMWPIYWKGDEVRLIKDCYTNITPTRGDIVVIQTPTSWLFRFILGLPHDLIDLDDRFNPHPALKVNGTILYNYRKIPYSVDKELFRFVFNGKLSYRIPDGYILMLPNDPSLYKKKHPFGSIPIDNVVGRISSADHKPAIGAANKTSPFDFFDASGKIGQITND